MKHYIMIAEIINCIGGSMIYQLNKLRYYKKRGYNVCLIHSDKKWRETQINEMRQYAPNYFEEFNFYPYIFSKDHIRKIIYRVVEIIKLEKNSTVIIESDGIIQSLWGEIIAEHFNGKHIIFILGEKVRIKEQNLFDFFDFKLDRKEIFGINKENAQYLFREWREIPLDKAPFLPAYCTNCMDEISYFDTHPVRKADFTIGTLGRLVKPYFNKNFYRVLDFIKQNPQYTFNLFLIGGFNDNTSRLSFEQACQTIPNLCCYITGTMYPVPVECVRLPDVYISQAGSVVPSRLLGIPTIRCNIMDALPCAIEQQTENGIIKDKVNTKDVSELLRQILLEKKYVKTVQPFDAKQANDIDFSDHEKIFSESSNDKKYYNVLSIRKRLLILYFQKTIMFLFGKRIYSKVQQLFNKFK